MSPALAVAPLARFQRRLAVLPGLEQLAWRSVRPEFDPFKYSSFPVRAGEEIYELRPPFGLTRTGLREVVWIGSRASGRDRGYLPFIRYETLHTSQGRNHIGGFTSDPYFSLMSS